MKNKSVIIYANESNIWDNQKKEFHFFGGNIDEISYCIPIEQAKKILEAINAERINEGLEPAYLQEIEPVIENFKTETEVGAGGCEDEYGDTEFYDTITGTVTIDGLPYTLRKHWSDSSDYLHVIDANDTIVGRIEFDGTDFQFNK